MGDTSISSNRPPWLVRWAVGAPLVAGTSVLFFARAWGVPWHGYSVAAVAVAAWILGVLAQWPWLRAGRERWVAVGLLVAAAGVLVYWAGWRLPRGLVHTAVPVVAMAGQVVIWRRGGWFRISEGARALARSVIFAAAVWLPLAWWRPGALALEFVRLENAAFLGLVMLLAWARAEVATGDTPARGSVVRGALVLAVAAAAGWYHSMGQGTAAIGAVFAGVGVGALVLALLAGWPRPAGRFVQAAVWWPEVALVVMALTTAGK